MAHPANKTVNISDWPHILVVRQSIDERRKGQSQAMSCVEPLSEVVYYNLDSHNRECVLHIGRCIPEFSCYPCHILELSPVLMRER